MMPDELQINANLMNNLRQLTNDSMIGQKRSFEIFHNGLNEQPKPKTAKPKTTQKFYSGSNTPIAPTSSRSSFSPTLVAKTHKNDAKPDITPTSTSRDEPQNPPDTGISSLIATSMPALIKPEQQNFVSQTINEQVPTREQEMRLNLTSLR